MDFDCDATQIAGPIADYFHGVAHTFATLSAGQSTFAIGAYGSGPLLRLAQMAGSCNPDLVGGRIALGGYDKYADWNIKQGHDHLKVIGLQVGGHSDYDSDVVKASAGTFLVLA